MQFNHARDLKRAGLALLLSVLSLWPGVFPCLSVAQESSAPSAEGDRTATAVEALSRLQGMDLTQNPKLKEAVLRVLEKTRGTANFVKLVRQFKLADQDAGLLEVAAQNPGNETGVEAMRLILAKKNFSLVRSALQGTNVATAARITEVLGNTGQNDAVRLLEPVLSDSHRDLPLRQQAVGSLARSLTGANSLLRLAKEGKLPADLKPTAASELSHAYWPEIQAQAAALLASPQNENAEALPPISELLKRKGDAANGAKIFSAPKTGCVNCHQIKGQGVDFGPNLSEVGSKLGKDAIYEAILNPSAGISFGFEGWQFQLQSGDEAYGLIQSETADEVAVKAIGGIVTRYKKSEIERREQLKLSIMPAGLQQAMTVQELVDLVEYLASLKK
jgi:putative heme-binding domain-containing protein